MIKNSDKKATMKTEKQMQKVLEFMNDDKEYSLKDICDVLSLKETRTKEILRFLIIDNRVEAIGANRNRKYRKRQ